MKSLALRMRGHRVCVRPRAHSAFSLERGRARRVPAIRIQPVGRRLARSPSAVREWPVLSRDGWAVTSLLQGYNDLSLFSRFVSVRKVEGKVNIFSWSCSRLEQIITAVIWPACVAAQPISFDSSCKLITPSIVNGQRILHYYLRILKTINVMVSWAFSSKCAVTVFHPILQTFPLIYKNWDKNNAWYAH